MIELVSILIDAWLEKQQKHLSIELSTKETKARQQEQYQRKLDRITAQIGMIR